MFSQGCPGSEPVNKKGESAIKDLVTVATYFNASEAHLARGLLAREGIDSFIFDENMGAVYPPLTVGGIKLKVRAADLERARALLDSLLSL